LDGTNAAVTFFVYNPANTFTGSFASFNYGYEWQNPGTHDVGYQIAILQNGTVYTPYDPEVQDAVDTRKSWATSPNPTL
jgi:hypothetical protein